MEFGHSYDTYSSDYLDNRRFLLKEAFDSHLCGLAIMKGIRDTSGKITDFAYASVNNIAKGITGVYDDNFEKYTLLSTYPGHIGSNLVEKLSQMLLNKAPAYFGAVLGNDGSMWNAAGIGQDDEVIIIYTNLSDYGLIKDFIGQTTITIEAQNAIRNKKKQVVDYKRYFIADASGKRYLASKFAVCKKLMQMFPGEIVRACLDDFKQMLERSNYIELKEYYGTGDQKTWVKNCVVRFKNSGIITFIDLSAVGANSGIHRTSVMQLHRANVELDEVSKVVAHDLKEPLRKIATFYDMMEDALNNPEKREKYSRNIRYIIHALQVKLDDLLLYLQIENKLNLTEVDMNDMLRRVLLSLDYSMPKPAPIISVSPLPQVTADSNMMFMLFQSLIANTIEFKTSGQLKVQVNCKVEENEYKFAIQDNGIGIDEKYAGKVFGLFQRLDADGYGTGWACRYVKRLLNCMAAGYGLNPKPEKELLFMSAFRSYDCVEN